MAKMRSCLLCVVTILCVTHAVVHCIQQTPKVKVDVYYESLCPDSINFIRYKLYPAYQQIKHIMDINLIPYGKARYTEYEDNVYISCHHGPNECTGNVIQSCAIDVLNNNMSAILPYINCMVNAIRPHKAGATCASQTGIEYEPIRDCSSGNKGKRLHLINGKRTQSLSPRLTFVPWVIINNQYTYQNQEQAISGDFKQLVCDNYSGTTPDECQT